MSTGSVYVELSIQFEACKIAAVDSNVDKFSMWLFEIQAKGYNEFKFVCVRFTRFLIWSFMHEFGRRRVYFGILFYSDPQKK